MLAARLGGRAGVGTRFAPQPVRHSSFKLWLKYAKPSHGTVVGRRRRRARAARRRHVSLLPVGIVDVDGAFDAGDAVEVARGDGDVDRQGDLQLLGRRAAAGHGPEVRRGARGAAARDRGGRPPRLLRARMTGGPLRAGRRLRYRPPRAPRSRPDVAGGLPDIPTMIGPLRRAVQVPRPLGRACGDARLT